MGKLDIFGLWLKFLDKLGITNPWEQRAVTQISILIGVVILIMGVLNLMF